MQSFLPLSLSLSFLFRAFVLSTSLIHICLMCACVCVSLFRFCRRFFFLSLLLIAHNDGDTRIEGRNLTKKEGRMCMHTRNRTQH